MIKPDDLLNRDLAFPPDNPDDPVAKALAAAGRMVQQLRERLALAHRLAPPSDPLVDPESWTAGRDAVLRVLERPVAGG
jgi:hypothetical protein